ncbi:hypothetical protein GC101_21990 [Paenibacillus sp. LMG 31459]|uniref:Uncharacterized protein n=1 Tax=Paenibacillus phytohabitans TaxID=2654978 RepID=A0ABX1YKH6_9BACL|nr:hypothetical protein [Paenibacillus phytohabitans]NOU81537.1 hypothetical protein [Paenibacillus phytohabitans]
MLKTRVLVLGVSRYSFPDEKNGNIIEGAKIHYCDADRAEEENVIGHTPQTAVVDYKEFMTMYTSGVPGYYDASMRISLTGRKPTLKIDAFEFVAPFSLVDKPVSNKAV